VRQKLNAVVVWHPSRRSFNCRRQGRHDIQMGGISKEYIRFLDGPIPRDSRSMIDQSAMRAAESFEGVSKASAG